MSGPEIFISSCSRRQLTRRRRTRTALRGPARGVVGIQLLIALVFLVAAFGVFMAGHGGF